MRGGGFSCSPCSPLRVPYLWAFIGSSLVFYKLLLLIKKIYIYFHITKCMKIKIYSDHKKINIYFLLF